MQPMQQTNAKEPKSATNAGRAGGTNAGRAGRRAGGTNAGRRAGRRADFGAREI